MKYTYREPRYYSVFRLTNTQEATRPNSYHLLQNLWSVLDIGLTTILEKKFT